MSKPTTQQIIAAIQAEVASPNPLIGRSAEWPEPSNAFEIIQLDEDADGNGGLTLGWNSNENHVIPAGTKVGEYVLMEPYFPQDNGGGKYRYEPKFSDPVALLEKTPFIFKTMDAEGDNLDLFTFPFTGLAGTIIGKLQDAIRQALGDNSWLCVTGQGITASITVDFDGDTLKSAAQKIAQACGCTLHYTWKQLNFGTRAVYGGNEFYNRFIVFGGTTNMSRKIVSGQYTSVVKRLTLNLDNYPDSVIDLSNGGTKMTKLLVFDDIYPKMELIVDSVYPRPCFLLDENGNKIPDGGYEVDGNDDYILDENGDRIPTYKKYTKWYVKLRYSDGTPFTLNEDIIIVGQTLKLLFQPDYDIFNPSQQQQEANTSPLAGRSFEVVYFDTTTKEYEADDVNQDGYTATEGWFRIIFTAEGETIIPTNPDLQLVPKIGNKVTLINVALTGNYVSIAQGQLLAAAQAVIGDFANVGLGGKAVAYPPLEDEEESDDSTEQQYPLPDVGGTYDNLFVSSKTTDLITGRQEISYGTFGERSLITSMIDKIDNAQTSGGGGTTKSGVVRSEEENTPNGQNRKTLQEAGGNLGVKTVTQYFNNQINGLIRDLDGVHEQVDQKIDMWFYNGVPYPNEYAPTHAPNVPVSEWDVDDYELHEQDLYYDISEVQDQYNSSNVWRWEKVNVNGTETWLWKNVTDAHTIDAMDKIFNVATDGILSAGAEKVRVYLEWRNCVHEYLKYKEQAKDFGILSQDEATAASEWTAYDLAFKALGQMLNGGAVIDISTVSSYTLAWFSNLGVNTTIPDKNAYKTNWDNYYATLTALLLKIQEAAKALSDTAQATAEEALSKITDMGSDGKLDPSEKVTVKRDFVSLYHEMMDSDDNNSGYAAGILDKAKDSNDVYIISEQAYITPYINAFNAIGTYLNGGSTWTLPDFDDAIDSYGNFIDSYLPLWLKDTGDHMEDTETINADTWVNLWSEFYARRAAVLGELSNLAHERLDDIADDGIISAGSEKTLLYLQWMRTVAEYKKYIEQAGDYFGNNNTEDDELVAAYKKVAVMLNNGNPNNASATISNDILDGLVRPSWLTEANMKVDTKLSLTPTTNAATYNTVWKNYHNALNSLLSLITEEAKNLADTAQSTAEEAMDLIGDMGDDTKLDPSEKLTVKREFLAAWHERDDEGGILDKCYDNQNPPQPIISVSYINSYLNAFKAVGSYLNGRTNGLPNQWTGITITSSTTDAQIENAMPAWIKDNALDTTEDISGDDWRTTWSDFFTARTAVFTALSEAAHNAADAAQTTADNAQEAIDKIVDDGVIAAGSEKARLLIEWKEVVAKYGVLKSLENVYPTQFGNYKGAIRSLASMLNGERSNYLVTDYWLGRFLNEDYLPDWIGDLYDIDIDLVDNGYTTAIYLERWENYYAALEALTNSKGSIFVIATTDNPNHPVPPYKIGDMWIIPDLNKELICIRGRDANQTYSAADWKEMSAEEDYRNALAIMVEQCYVLIKDELPAQWHHFTVFLCPNSSSLISPDTGDVVYIHNSSTISYYDEDGIEQTVTSSAESYDSLLAALEVVYNKFVDDSVETFDVFSSKTDAGNIPQDNSLVAKEISYTDPVTNEPLKGGIDVFWYNGTQWELIAKAISAAIENLGNAVRMVVFGSEDYGDNIAGSGTAFEKAIGAMFSEIYDSEGNRLASAKIATYIEGSNGNYLSGVKINANNVTLESDGRGIIGAVFTLDSNGNAKLNANKINFNAQGFSLDANKVNFQGQDIDLTATNSLKLNASQLDFSGQEVNLSSATKINFGSNSVSFTDRDGNVYIEIISNADGIPVMNFYDSNGNLTYQLGKDGLIEISQNGYLPFFTDLGGKFYIVSGNRQEKTVQSIYNQFPMEHGFNNCYLYHKGVDMSGNDIDPTGVDGKIFDSDEFRGGSGAYAYAPATTSSLVTGWLFLNWSSGSGRKTCEVWKIKNGEILDYCVLNMMRTYVVDVPNSDFYYIESVDGSVDGLSVSQDGTSVWISQIN